MATNGTKTIANAIDRQGNSHGCYVKLDHGDGLSTIYAPHLSICEQIQTGEVRAYVVRPVRAKDHISILGCSADATSETPLREKAPCFVAQIMKM